jgi:hypothetical protein
MVRRYVSLFAATLFAASAWAAVPAVAGQQPNAVAFEARIHRLCTYMGLDPDTAPFTTCVIDLKYWTDASSAAGARLLTPEPPAPPPATYTGAYGFFRSPPQEQRQREKAACAGLGIAPASGFVDQCAAATDATLERYNLVGAD